MNAPEPTQLLLRDKAELDKIAFAFREGRTVTAFIVCPPSLRAATLLVPEAARVHGQHLIRAGQFDEALTILVMAETTAREEELLREVANAIRWGIVAAVHANKPEADMKDRIKSLRETLASSDSPRLTAEQLLELASSLPASSTLPDPLLLADEASDLFAAMPYPAIQARCMEPSSSPNPLLRTNGLRARSVHLKQKRLP